MGMEIGGRAFTNNNGYSLMGRSAIRVSALITSTCTDKLLQFLLVHPLDPGHDPASEWTGTSVHTISTRDTGFMHHSHGSNTAKLRFYGYLHSVLVQRFQNRERGQDLGNDRPRRCVRKVSPNADASAKSKCHVFTVIGFEGPVVVEEPLREERVWI